MALAVAGMFAAPGLGGWRVDSLWTPDEVHDLVVASVIEATQLQTSMDIFGLQLQLQISCSHWT